MKEFIRSLRVSFILLCGAGLLLGRAALGSDGSFGNLTVTNDALVGDTLSVTNIVPFQANAAVFLKGSDSDGNADGGGLVLSGGAGYDHTGDGYGSNNGGSILITGGASPGGQSGSVILQGGNGTAGEYANGYAGDVVLKNGVSYLAVGGNVKLETSDGTTRFYLQSDGTLNANNNYIKNSRVLPQGDLSMGSFTAP